MSKNLFNSIKLTRPKKNVFDLSHDVKMSFQMGDLIPTACIPAVPGDKFKVCGTAMIRFSPMLAPIMHMVDVYQHWFFVPKRLLWPAWEKWITNGGSEGPGDFPPTLPAYPTMELSTATWTEGSLLDYLGLPDPQGSVKTYEIDAMPMCAYQRIWNDYYRDQNLSDKRDAECIDGHNSIANVSLAINKRAWEHDYFTSALPFAQKGAPVQLPLTNGADVPVKARIGIVPTSTLLDGTPNDVNVEGDATTLPASADDLFAKTSDLTAEAATINDLRRAFRLQEWLEKMARGGTRLKEVIWEHFGVDSKDARLQRPEYITGTRTPVTISEVLNTTGTDDNPQGNMAGHGISVTNGKHGTYYCPEHGYIMCIMSILPKTAYQDGIPKKFIAKTDPSEEYWPAFANIGEQPIINKEVMAFPTTLTDVEETFGYVPRYAEYKFENSRVAGQFRSSLNFWHMGRIFDPAAPPELNDTFILADPTQRIFAVTDTAVQKIIAHVYNEVKAVRPMPKFGTPQF